MFYCNNKFNHHKLPHNATSCHDCNEVESNLYQSIVFPFTYRQVSNIRRTKFEHLKDCPTVLWLCLPNPLKADVKSRMNV